MCMRFYPDLVVAVSVKDAINCYFKWYMANHNGNVPTLDQTKKMMSCITVSPRSCAERQRKILRTDLANVFYGYGDDEWSIEDFKSYLDKMPDIFSSNKDNFGLCVDFSNSSSESASIFVKEYCRNMLTQGVYENGILRKFGLL